MASRRTWLAVVGESTARDLARKEWRSLPLLERAQRPTVGDRVAVVVTRVAKSVLTASVLGTVDVRPSAQGEDVRIRHRFVSPAGHEPRITDIPALATHVGWSDAHLRSLLGGVGPLPARDFAHVEDAVRARALSEGPAPKRRRHATPRTPARRALTTARIRARGRAGR